MTCWFEELPKNYYVEVIAKKRGAWSKNWNENVIKKQVIRIKDIDKFKRQYEKHNLFRSLDVYKDLEGSRAIGRCPIVLDIDYDNLRNPIPNLNDLERVREVAVQAMRVLETDINIPKGDIQIVFSGCKGFHLEVRREFNQALKIRESLIERLRKENGEFGYGNHVAKDIGIDPINENHQHVRIKNTWNSWKESSKELKCRKCIELSHDELKSLNVNQIVNRATRSTESPTNSTA